MNCSELQEDLDLYSLGLLDQAGRAKVREHLDSGCGKCQKELLDLWAANALVLRSLAPGSEVPSRLRREALGFTISTPPNYRLAPLAAAASLLVCALAGWQALRFRNELIAAKRESALLRNASLLVSAVGVRQATFGESGNTNGRAFVDPQRGAALFATGLRPLPKGETYQMWLIPQAGAPRPAGLFQPQPDGSALSVYLSGHDATSIKAIAVSREPLGGSPQPTSQPLIVAPL